MASRDELSGVIAETMIAVGTLTATVLVWTPAPYGRFSSSTSCRKGYGPLIPSRIAWIVQESPSFLVPVGVLAIGGEEVLNQMSWKAKMLGCCFLVHYLHRALLYPLQTRPSKPTPLITSLLAYIFTALNGLLQVSMWLLSDHWSSVSNEMWLLGVLIWLGGAALNVQTDYHLLHLRTSKGAGYHIPTADPFQLVSCPNFLGEILEWLGYAIACRHLAGFAFAWFTICNLAPRALHHHQFYKQMFRSAYPSGRKALIPYLL